MPANSHSHADHSHAPTSFGLAFAVGIALNAGFVIAEIVYGLRSHSLALVADAGHNSGDVLGLVAAWAASRMVRKLPTSKHTYGFRRTTILAALLNTVLLLLATGAIIFEGVRRLFQPADVVGSIVMAVAAIGIWVNLVTALMFMSGRDSDLNVKGAFQHMAGDAVVAFGVVIAGLAIRLTGIKLIDPVVSIAVALLVVIATWRVLRESIDLALDAVPEGIDSDEVKQFLEGLTGVDEIHDLHIWAMSTTEVALTCHLVHPAPQDDTFISEVCEQLHDKFGIEHATLQIEHGDCGVPCVIRQSPV